MSQEVPGSDTSSVGWAFLPVDRSGELNTSRTGMSNLHSLHGKALRRSCDPDFAIERRLVAVPVEDSLQLCSVFTFCHSFQDSLSH